MAALVPLGRRWTFSVFRKTGARQEPYEAQMKVIASIGTASEFWGVVCHCVPLSQVHDSIGVDVHLFREGIQPMWEDAANRDGGKWTLRLKKGLAHRYWEELLMAVVGEHFDVGEELCGCVLSCRHTEDIISVWNKTSLNRANCLRIQQTIRRVLELPLEAHFEYKPHVQALKDMSSYSSYRGASERTVLKSEQ
mmetsp:Transcript_31942/g.74536  ORF Transcript_31942/g.74536 Transcript_31942/m.74536 type:complete len:194 (-) Transcript_31942:336-917(-)